MRELILEGSDSAVQRLQSCGDRDGLSLLPDVLSIMFVSGALRRATHEVNIYALIDAMSES